MNSKIPKMAPGAALLLVILLMATAFAQTSATLSGTVQDQQGNVIAGAKVTVSDPTKSQRFDTTSGDAGTFSFPALQPGTYTLTVEMAGFKQLVKTGIVINTADRQSAGTLTLEVGEVSAIVEVVAESAQLTIKTESGEQSEVITGRQLREIAVNGRNYLDLMKLIPGTVSTVNGQVAGPGGFSGFNINGTRNNQHNLTIDGSTNVDTGSNGTQHVALTIDTIAEFKVLTSNGREAAISRSSLVAAVESFTARATCSTAMTIRTPILFSTTPMGKTRRGFRTASAASIATTTSAITSAALSDCPANSSTKR